MSHTLERTLSSSRLRRQLPLQVASVRRERSSGLPVDSLAQAVLILPLPSLLLSPCTLPRAMWADLLMTEVIPEGASSCAASSFSLALRTPPSSQNRWTEEFQEQRGPILMI
eukprot:gene744-826_t